MIFPSPIHWSSKLVISHQISNYVFLFSSCFIMFYLNSCGLDHAIPPCFIDPLESTFHHIGPGQVEAFCNQLTLNPALCAMTRPSWNGGNKCGQHKCKLLFGGGSCKKNRHVHVWKSMVWNGLNMSNEMTVSSHVNLALAKRIEEF